MYFQLSQCVLIFLKQLQIRYLSYLRVTIDVVGSIHSVVLACAYHLAGVEVAVDRLDVVWVELLVVLR